jgi:hypothetical protein
MWSRVTNHTSFEDGSLRYYFIRPRAFTMDNYKIALDFNDFTHIGATCYKTNKNILVG